MDVRGHSIAERSSHAHTNNVMGRPDLGCLGVWGGGLCDSWFCGSSISNSFWVIPVGFGIHGIIRRTTSVDVCTCVLATYRCGDGLVAGAG